MPKLAFMTVGRLEEPFDHEKTEGFLSRVPGVYDAANAMPGFLGMSVRDLETFQHSWGPMRYPRCYGEDAPANRMATTLSLWEDIESVVAFAYSGAHKEALVRGREWFPAPFAPEYVAFWVDDSVDRVDWQEAADRLDCLHANGATAHAFDFKKPFDALGNPMALDRTKIRGKSG